MTLESEPPQGSPDTELRFGFGANWSEFLATVDAARIARAEQTIVEMLGVSSLAGKRFLDVGSGSGLFSLAARRLGARVHSFDYDRNSVACTTTLRGAHFPDDPTWTVEQGSVLDRDYLGHLGRFDIVYAWGSLHHTGDMWAALANVDALVAEGGTLFVSIYNDQGWPSRAWTRVKRAYNALPPALRPLVLGPSLLRLWGPTLVRDSLRLDPLATWREYGRNRGMSAWHDVVDWVGGYPFEVARPEELLDFYRPRGYALQRLKTCAGGIGCNEYVFRRGT